MLRRMLSMLSTMIVTASPALAQVTPFTFAHISDTHLRGAPTAADTNLQAAIAEMNAMATPPAFGIHTGDIVETGAEAEFLRYREMISAQAIPFYHTPGNHETRWADQSINRFTRHFGSPNISFKRDGVRFVGFNAAIWLEHHGAVSGDTRRWIVEQLALDAPGTPAVLFAHQPPMYPDNVFTTGDVELWEAIKPYNVRLFINGHGHINKTWTVNGVLCKMVKGMMNDTGAYSLYEVTPTEIRVYDKPVGKDRVRVATVPLSAPGVTVNLAAVGVAGGSLLFQAIIASGAPTVSRVEYQLDHHDHPADENWTRLVKSPDGRYRGSVPVDTLAQGRHTLAVRAVDSTGGVWIKTVPITLPGPITAGRFDAGTALQGPAAADADTVYVGGWDGALYAVAKDTMKPRWIYKTGGAIIARPDVDGERVYLGSTDGSLIALDRATGQRLWERETDGPIQGHLLAADGAVFAASGDHKVHAVEAATGALRWTYTMGLHAQSRPAYGDGAIYLGAWDNGFYALDARTGARRWRITVGSIINFAPAVTSPCVVDGRVILTAAQAAGSPNVWCLDARTGQILWQQRIANGQSPYGSPTSDGLHVYCGALDGSLWALGLEDGTILWTVTMPEILYDGSPVVVGGQVVCNSLYGGVQGYNAANGSPLWRYKTGAGLQFAWPTVSGQAVYQTSMDGFLTAIPLPPGPGDD